MNIAYFINHYPTKHKIVAHDEIIEMTKRGHQVTVIAVWGGEKDKIKNIPFNVTYLSSSIKWKNLLKIFIQFFIRSIKHLNLLKKYLGIQDSLKFFSNYSDISDFENIDHIHAHFANNAALKGFLLSKFLNKPFTCTGHGSDLLVYPKPYLKELILNSKPFITISNYNKNFLIKKYSLKSTDIEVNYCGIDAEYFKSESTNFIKKFTILSVTALKEVKGVKYLIEACLRMKEMEIDFKCNIIGGGPDFDDLNQMINSYHLNDQVFLLCEKSQEEIKENLSKSQMFALPSISEGIPVAVMEAMSMELPVIATNITGLPEIIENGKNGYLVPPKDATALAEKMIDLINNEEKRIRFGKEARKTVLKKFNLEKNVKRFEKIITGQII